MGFVIFGVKRATYGSAMKILALPVALYCNMGATQAVQKATVLTRVALISSILLVFVPKIFELPSERAIFQFLLLLVLFPSFECEPHY